MRLLRLVSTQSVCGNQCRSTWSFSSIQAGHRSSTSGKVDEPSSARSRKVGTALQRHLGDHSECAETDRGGGQQVGVLLGRAAEHRAVPGDQGEAANLGGEAAEPVAAAVGAGGDGARRWSACRCRPDWAGPALRPASSRLRSASRVPPPTVTRCVSRGRPDAARPSRPAAAGCRRWPRWRRTSDRRRRLDRLPPVGRVGDDAGTAGRGSVGRDHRASGELVTARLQLRPACRSGPMGGDAHPKFFPSPR